MTRHHEVKRKKCDGFPYLRVGFTGITYLRSFYLVIVNGFTCTFLVITLQVITVNVAANG